MREEIRFRGKINAVVISRTAEKWFASFGMEVVPTARPCESQAVVGVDMGVLNLATLSTGEVIEGPKPYGKALKRLRRQQRRVSKKKKGSNNRHKARMRLAKAHYRVRSIRQDALHKLTTYLTESYGTIATAKQCLRAPRRGAAFAGIEDLNVKGMMANRRLALVVAEMGFFEFRRQLEYKARVRGNRITVVNRYFPSSKLCSLCGAKDETLTLSDRMYECGQCGLEMDRDVNAAINLRNTASSAGIEACGEEGSGLPARGVSASCGDEHFKRNHPLGNRN